MFDHLDDDAPIEPTDATRRAVDRRAAQLRRRRTVAPGAALIVIVAIGLAGIATAGRDNGHQKITAVGNVSAEPLLAHLELEHDGIVAPGGALVVDVVVINPTSKRIEITDHGCRPKWAIAIVKPGARVTGAWDDMCESGSLNIPPGTSRWRYTTRAANFGVALAPGDYEARFVSDTRFPNFVPPTPIPIRVRAASPASLHFSIHLDHNDVAAGGKLMGYVEVVNPTNQRIDLSGTCGLKWAVGLAAPGEVPSIAFTRECSSKRTLVPPGTTRWPFTVTATYNTCVSTPQPGFPSCLPGGGVPPLPKGRYNASIVWGSAPEGLVDPAPVPVTVR